jgi:site-specific DNA-methyltransferase (adenine-specific)
MMSRVKEGTMFVTADCIPAMDDLIKNGEVFDHVVTSPPYNIGMDYGTYRDNLPMANYLAWTKDWMARVKALLSPGGSFFLNIGGSPSEPWVPFEVAIVARDLGFQLQNRITWVKSINITPIEAGSEAHTHGHVRPITSKRFLNNTSEPVFHFTFAGNVEIARYAQGVGVPFVHASNLSRWGHGRTLGCGGNTWFIPYKTIQSKDDRAARHPATFPPELPLKCLRLAGESGQRVLDPFGGVGSTAIACRQLGMDFVSIEIDPAYNLAAEARFNQFDEHDNGRSEDESPTAASVVLQSVNSSWAVA